MNWQATEFFDGELGQAYLGSQGDIWDAQKDSLLAMLGAIIGLRVFRWFMRSLMHQGKRRPSITPRVLCWKSASPVV